MSEESERNGIKLKTPNTSDDYQQHQFHVLDEVTNDSDDNASVLSDSDIPDDEIDKLLEDAFKNDKKRSAGEAGLGNLLLITHCTFYH